MKLVFLGDLANTGFGSVTMDLGRALLDRGVDVRFISQNDSADLPEPFASRTFVVGHPDGTFVMGTRLLGLLDGSEWGDGWVPDAAVILGDFRGVEALVLRHPTVTEGFSRTPTFHYIPIEGVGLPPAWARLWRGRGDGPLYPVAMSEFGAEHLDGIIGYRPPVVYHGIDPTVFHPVSDADPIIVADDDSSVKLRGRSFRHRDSVRIALGVPRGTKLILRTDRQMPRKQYPSLLRALVRVLATRADVQVVLHCRNQDEGGDLADELSKYRPEFCARVHVTDAGGGVSRTTLALLYNAADLYVSNSAEGFGLTLAEAIACGTAAVGARYSAVPEVIGPAGVTVPEGGLVDNQYQHFWWLADEVAFARAVGDLLDNDAERARLGKLGPAHVREHFSWSRAAEQFEALIVDVLAGGAPELTIVPGSPRLRVVA